jgi:hypothetical protein
MRRLALWFVLLGLSGCAGDHASVSNHSASHHGPDGVPRSGLSHSSQKDSAQEALVLKREADQLREMAERREREAQLLSNEPGADPQAVSEKRGLAQRLLEAANQADREAAALSRQVPHNMVQ